MIEQRCFVIPEHSQPHLVADELDKAFEDGWQYVTYIPVGRGLLVITARVKPEPQNGAAAKKPPAKAGAR